MFADRYKIDQRIGTGGMGAVYSADDLHLGRKVALKIISQKHMNEPRQVARFRREAEVVCNLSHPHVVRVLDVGQGNGREYLAMDLLEGMDLFDAIQLVGTYEPQDAVTILDQVLEALEAAHAASLVHRDLKPENIFLAQEEGGEINVKLLDFGVVKVPEEGAQAHLTRTGTVVGTPEYMAPEQATSGKVDARADLYALGCIAQAMLCGRPPFVNKSVVLVMTAHVTEKPVPPSQLRGDLKAPEAVDAFIGKALEKKPDRRYQTAGEMRKALARMASALGAQLSGRRITLPAMSVDAARAVASTLVPTSTTKSSPGAATMIGQAPGVKPATASPDQKTIPTPAPAPAAAAINSAPRHSPPIHAPKRRAEPNAAALETEELEPARVPRPPIGWLLAAAVLGAILATLVTWVLLRRSP
jgi:serine/threonine-protein kinase